MLAITATATVGQHVKGYLTPEERRLLVQYRMFEGLRTTYVNLSNLGPDTASSHFSVKPVSRPLDGMTGRLATIRTKPAAMV